MDLGVDPEFQIYCIFVLVGKQELLDGARKPEGIGGLRRSQTFGQKLMENMFDNFFRKAPSKAENQTSDAATHLPKVSCYCRLVSTKDLSTLLLLNLSFQVSAHLFRKL